MTTKPTAQIERFQEAARELGCDEDEARFNGALKKVAHHKATPEPKVCPECGHVFQGSGWDGIDAHWKAKHDDAMPYKEAWPLIRSGKYKPAE